MKFVFIGILCPTLLLHLNRLYSIRIPYYYFRTNSFFIKPFPFKHLLKFCSYWTYTEYTPPPLKRENEVFLQLQTRMLPRQIKPCRPPYLLNGFQRRGVRCISVLLPTIIYPVNHPSLSYFVSSASASLENLGSHPILSSHPTPAQSNLSNLDILSTQS